MSNHVERSTVSDHHPGRRPCLDHFPPAAATGPVQDVGDNCAAWNEREIEQSVTMSLSGFVNLTRLATLSEPVDGRGMPYLVLDRGVTAK